MRFRKETEIRLDCLFARTDNFLKLLQAANSRIDHRGQEIASLREEFAKEIKQLRDEIAEEFAKRDRFIALTPEPTLFNAEPSEMPAIPVREKPVKPEWVSGAEAAKMLGWQFCSSSKLMKMRITFRQPAKNKPLTVNVRSIEDFIQRRRKRTRKSAAIQKEC